MENKSDIEGYAHVLAREDNQGEARIYSLVLD